MRKTVSGLLCRDKEQNSNYPGNVVFFWCEGEYDQMPAFLDEDGTWSKDSLNVKFQEWSLENWYAKFGKTVALPKKGRSRWVQMEIEVNNVGNA